MQNHELAEIDASMQAIIRRAYALGRAEALKKVVDALSVDHPDPDQLALMGPDESMGAEHEPAETKPSGKTPWWAWPVR